MSPAFKRKFQGIIGIIQKTIRERRGVGSKMRGFREREPSAIPRNVGEDPDFVELCGDDQRIDDSAMVVHPSMGYYLELLEDEMEKTGE